MRLIRRLDVSWGRGSQRFPYKGGGTDSSGHKQPPQALSRNTRNDFAIFCFDRRRFLVNLNKYSFILFSYF